MTYGMVRYDGFGQGWAPETERTCQAPLRSREGPCGYQAARYDDWLDLCDQHARSLRGDLVAPYEAMRAAVEANQRAQALARSEARRLNIETRTQTYVARADDLAKIGRSVDPVGRIRTLNVERGKGLLLPVEPVPWPLVLEATIPHDCEKDLHARFLTSWLRGEWFRWTGPVAEFVREIQVAA